MIYTEAMFLKHVGRLPENDDLERANCIRIGEAGHKACGICPHMLPVFVCQECFVKATLDSTFKRIDEICVK